MGKGEMKRGKKEKERGFKGRNGERKREWESLDVL